MVDHLQSGREYQWGILGPEVLPSFRRTRTLGLAAAIRHLNDLAVPGLGGVWYAKRLLLPTLSLVVAESVRARGKQVGNTEVANAIEALACLLAYRSSSWSADDRLRGSTILRSREGDSGNKLPFAQVRQPGFYVSQPMRMASVQALPALGLVEAGASRFNGFRVSEAGREFVDLALRDYAPFKRKVAEHLVAWVQGQTDQVSTPPIVEALSPLIPMNAASLAVLRSRLELGTNEEMSIRARRRNALNWVSRLAKDWQRPAGEAAGAKDDSSKPPEIDDDHWRDLKAGKAFFSARDKAIAVLDSVEKLIGPGGQMCRLMDAAQQAGDLISELRASAIMSQEQGLAHPDALTFCFECANQNDAHVLQQLVARDGRVLRLVGSEIRPAGPAFHGGSHQSAEIPEGDEDVSKYAIPVPDGFSFRVRNLYRLTLDLNGNLSDWLAQQAKERQHGG